MEKPLEQKLAECRTVVIQNIEKTMQNAIVYRYLREEKL